MTEIIRVGVLGATSFVGEILLPMLVSAGYSVVAFSRESKASSEAEIQWCQLDAQGLLQQQFDNMTPGAIPFWVCFTPIVYLSDYFPLMQKHNARRVIAFSSTSRFTRADSSDKNDVQLASSLVQAEENLRQWAEQNQVNWLIFRPTLVYGYGKDKNICEIAQLINRFGIFPLLGSGVGLRQPVHAEDLAKACLAALSLQQARNYSYNLSGGEKLTYKDMVRRIFTALDRKPRFVSLPKFGFRLILYILRLLPRFRSWSYSMVERMEKDMAFEYQDAATDLNFAPRPFQLQKQDLPPH